jgi:phage FluMu gp28-like protein
VSLAAMKASLERMRKALPEPTRPHPLMPLLRANPAAAYRKVGVTLDPWQARVVADDSDQAAVLCCRGAGKSYAEAARVLARMLTRPRHRVLFFSPTHRQSSEVLGYARELWERMGRPLRATRDSVTILEFANGSRALSLPDNQKGVRGLHVDELVLDEAAQLSDELYVSVRPMVMRRRGKIRAATTPFGKRGWFWELWDKRRSWNKVKVTARDSGRYTEEQLAREYEEMGERSYRQEYELEFHDAVDAVFTQDDIDAAMDDSMQPLFDEWRSVA